MQPAIVIPAYNRPNALARLLNSLQAANYPARQQIPFVISIDPENGISNPAVLEVAESFDWQFGDKRIIQHKEHLGLLQNFYYCGGLTEEYGAVIFLEDDLFVSSVFYHYAMQSLEYFQNASNIGGISLYRYAFNGYTHFPFEPLANGVDIFFMQLPSIMGQAWTRRQWFRFQEWQNSASMLDVKNNPHLHPIWSTFDDQDYFPVFVNYLVSTGQYYVFPHTSLTTGFGDSGTHFKNSTAYFQIPLQREQKDFRFHGFENSNVIYDSFMEILPECLQQLSRDLQGFDFAVDLNATKRLQHLKSKYVLTTRASRKTLKSFALVMHPLEANMIHNIAGNGISLCEPTNLLWSKWKDFQTDKKLYDYFLHGQHLSLGKFLAYFMFNLIGRFKPWFKMVTS